MAVVSRRSSRRRFTLILLVLTSITLVTLDFRGFEPLERARSAMLSALAPVGDFAARVVRPIGDAWDGALQQGTLADENERLRQLLEEARGEALQNQIASESLQQLLAQANLPFVGDIPTVTAPVVSGAVSNFSTTTEIGKGSSDGIKAGMAVVTGRGLVGRVSTVSSDRSVVQLLSGGQFRVGFSVVGSPAVGTARGTGQGRNLEGRVDVANVVVPGEILVTDGISERSAFPRGLPIGTVAEVRSSPGALQRDLSIEMFGEVSDLTYLTVVLWEPSE